MPSKRLLMFTGVAVALAGVTAVAAAERVPVHVMTVQLPDGSVEQIHYTGNVAPRIVVRDEAAPMVAAGFLDAAFGVDSPFAELDRISAEMDRQAALMMRQAALMHASPDAALHAATLAGAPAGASSFSMVSTSNGQGVCTRSVQVTSMGDGKAPKVERSSSGACGTAAAQPSAAPATPAEAKPGPIPRNSI
ncbi:hypothetical protein [Sphingomonas sp. PR090111-T3T-6A]|uniref:hypothetical protein n=1 Tax=Sphingomonas sp. PR090111-T3T-6A TaxID=685778 RepID=UPI00037189CC|nr:hypothetical protein [Sphingomonas sp. PR090111-T3T-6A]